MLLQQLLPECMHVWQASLCDIKTLLHLMCIIYYNHGSLAWSTCLLYFCLYSPFLYIIVSTYHHLSFPISSFLFYAFFFPYVTKNDVDNFNFRIRADDYKDRVRFRYDPFCVRSRIVITAVVEEAGRGTNQSASLTIPLVANPVSVKFSEQNPKIFKAGLNYVMRVSTFPANW